MKPFLAGFLLAQAVVCAAALIDEPEATYRFQGNLDSDGSVKHKLFVPLPSHNAFEKVKVVWTDGKPALHTVLYKVAGNNGPDLNINGAPRKEYTLAFMLSLDSVADVHLLDLKTLTEYKDGHDLNIVDGVLVAQQCVLTECSKVDSLPDTPTVKPEAMNMFVLTRDASGVVRIYVNGHEAMTFNDETEAYVLSERIFFLQDDFWGEQTSPGFMASIRLFNLPHTPDEVKASLSDAEIALLGKSFGKSGLVKKPKSTSGVSDKEKGEESREKAESAEMDKLGGLVQQKDDALKGDEETISSLKSQLDALKSELKAKGASLDDAKEELSQLQERMKGQESESSSKLYQCEAGWAKANLTISELRSKLASSAGALNATAAELAADEKRALLAEGKSVGLDGEVKELTSKLKQAQNAEEGEKAALQLEMDEDTKLKRKVGEKDERIMRLLEKLRKANETIADLEVTGSDDEKILAYVGRVRTIVENRKDHNENENVSEAVQSPGAVIAETNEYAPVLLGCAADTLTEGHESVRMKWEGDNHQLTSPAHCALLCREKDESYTHVGVRYGGLVCVCAHDESVHIVPQEQCALLCSNGSECGSEKDNIFSFYRID